MLCAAYEYWLLQLAYIAFCGSTRSCRFYMRIKRQLAFLVHPAKAYFQSFVCQLTTRTAIQAKKGRIRKYMPYPKPSCITDIDSELLNFKQL